MAGILSKKEREERLKRVRERMNKEKGGRKDPFEFRAPKTEGDEEANFYFRVLPELGKGEKCEGGVAAYDYDYFFYKNGAHWVDKQKIECPRMHDDEECPICKLGFDLMEDTQAQSERSEIAKKYLARTYYATNVYFLNTKENPEELRGKVKWFSVGKTIYDLFDDCINNSDPGSDLDPKAYGDFYDCEEGYVFKLNVKRKGDWNTYTASQFLPKMRGPLVKDKDDNLDVEAAQKILDQRHDLAAKYDPRDKDKLREIVSKIAGGDSSGDFDVDEEKIEAPAKDEIVEELPSESQNVESITEEPAKAEPAKTETKAEETPVEKEKEDEELANLLEEIKGGKK